MPSDTTYLDTITKTDTIFGVSDTALPIRQPKKIKTHTSKPTKVLFNPTLHQIKIANWQIILLLLAVLLMGFVKAFSNNRFSQGIKSLFNYTVAQEITREEKVFFHRSNVFFTIIHLLTSSLFLYHLKNLFNTNLFVVEGVYGFTLIFTFLTLTYIVKYLFSKLLLFVFNDLTIAAEYVFNVSLYNNLLGVVFVPLLCLFYFTALKTTTVLCFVALPILLIIFFLRLIRLFKIGQSKGVSYFYIIVYICSLEILPLAILLKIFIF